MFSSMVASGCTLDVISGGTNGTRNGALQVVYIYVCVCVYFVFDLLLAWFKLIWKCFSDVS